MATLLITAALEPAALAHFDTLRQQYFPPERNHLPAHLTLFHKLPGSEEAFIRSAMGQAFSATRAINVSVTGTARFGQGVAYRLASPPLLEIRQTLARAFSAWLSPQDQQHWSPHITVQNKVAQKVADQTLAKLTAEFTPHVFAVTGLLLWEYLGGPWRPVAEVPLR